MINESATVDLHEIKGGFEIENGNMEEGAMIDIVEQDRLDSILVRLVDRLLTSAGFLGALM